MIICTDASDAIQLNDLLRTHKKKTLLAHSNMIFDEVHGIRADWKASVSGMYPILICTDDVLPDLDIKDVTWLIHQSVNLATKSRFYYRFSTLMDNWHSSTIEVILIYSTKYNPELFILHQNIIFFPFKGQEQVQSAHNCG